MSGSIKALIEKRAYELFVERGGEHGYAVDDWHQAEKEILASLESKESRKKPEPKKSEPVVKSAPVAAAAPKAIETKSSAPAAKSAGKAGKKAK